jgi:hypothetical protein
LKRWQKISNVSSCPCTPFPLTTRSACKGIISFFEALQGLKVNRPGKSLSSVPVRKMGKCANTLEEQPWRYWKGEFCLRFIGSSLAIVFNNDVLPAGFLWRFFRPTPHSISAKLTNASLGIVFPTIGMILSFVDVLQKPVRLQTDENGSRAEFKKSGDAKVI